MSAPVVDAAVDRAARATPPAGAGGVAHTTIGLSIRCRPTDDSREEGHASRTDEQAQDDQQHPVEHRPADGRDDPGDDEHDGDDPEDEVHGSVDTRRARGGNLGSATGLRRIVVWRGVIEGTPREVTVANG